jgi:hypothetical protein
VPLARSFYEAGFSVAIDDMIIGERYEDLKPDLSGLPFDLVVLAPWLEVVVNERDAGRGKRVLGDKWVAYLDDALRETLAGVGIWNDNSEQTPSETVDEIARRLEIQFTV